MKTPNGPSAADKRAHLFLSGTVQGVGMRAYVHRLGSGFSLSGWVKNLPDGRVEAILEGPKKQVEETVRQIQSGHFSGYITDIELNWENSSGELKGFEIRW